LTATDEIRHLPDLNKGYILKEATAFEIVFKHESKTN
jgi:hypothetical protein